MKKNMAIVSVIIILLLVVTGCGGKVSATVNGEKITETQLKTRVEQVAAMYGYDSESQEGKDALSYLQEQTLQMLIEERVVLQAAAEKKITAENADVEAEFKKIREQFKDEQEYKSFLDERKFKENDLKGFINNQLVLNKLFDQVTQDITSTSRDVKKYYDENKLEFYEAEQIKARNIVVKTEDEAKAIIARLDKGEDFAQLAVELSIDPTAKTNQGDIGYFGKEAQMVDEFKNAAFLLKVGEYTKKPVQSMFGYHIIKVEDKKAAHQYTFEEIKQELEERFLMEEKNEKFSVYVDELMEKAKIEKNLPEKKVEEGTDKGTDNTSQPPADSGQQTQGK